MRDDEYFEMLAQSRSHWKDMCIAAKQIIHTQQIEIDLLKQIIKSLKEGDEQ